MPFWGAWQPTHQRYLEMLNDAWDLAIVRLSTHPMLDAYSGERSIGHDIRMALEHVRRNLSWFATRSVVSVSKEPEPEIVPSLYVRDFDGFDDADFCAGLGAAVPIEQVEGFEPPRLTRYSDEPIPPPEAFATAFEDILAHFDPPEVLARLEPMVRGQNNKRLGHPAPRLLKLTLRRHAWSRFATLAIRQDQSATLAVGRDG